MRVTPRPQREPLVPPGAIEHHVRDMTATFASDVTLTAARARLAQHGQWLPIDGEPDAPLARLAEKNSTGPLRLGYGAWRDLLLGCQFRNGAGQLITAGGRTVKNVAGYDLTKFLVGQQGIFGEIVTLTTRTYRKPQAALHATFEPDVRRLCALLTTPARPQWAILTMRQLTFGYLGDGQSIAFYERELPRHRPVEVRRQSVEEDEALLRSLWSRPALGDNVSFRASVPPSAIAAFASEAQLADWSADAAFGIVVGVSPETQLPAIQGAAARAGGSVLFLDGAGRPVQLGVDDSARELLRRLKRAFDPQSQLNPLPADD